jgi:hypothetical protein
MPQKNNMVIQFMDGTKVVYDFPEQSDDSSSLATRYKEILDMQYIVVEAEGAIQFYPVANIKSIQLYPLPEVIPDFVIQGAKLIDVY